MASPVLRVRRLRPHPQPLALPAYQSSHASGLDLCADLETELTLVPGAREAVPTGLAVAIPPGFEGQVRPRSGLALRHGITCLNSPGTIDADYRGEVKVLLINLGQAPVTLHRGDRIAQLVIAPVAQLPVVEVETLDDTARGEGGFGSTGR